MRFALLLVSATLAACTSGHPEDPALTAAFDFSEGRAGWRAGFADYPAGEEAFYELEARWRALPARLGGAPALFISGNNHSDDLFMFWKRRVDGLQPGAAYDVHVTVEIASNAPSGCVGIGGAPGESVYVKAGATRDEPRASGPGSALNVDKGNQASGGTEAVVLGDVANGRPCNGEFPYVFKLLASDAPVRVVASDAGAAWLLVGTDSGFEGQTALYYARITSEFHDAEP